MTNNANAQRKEFKLPMLPPRAILGLTDPTKPFHNDVARDRPANDMVMGQVHEDGHGIDNFVNLLGRKGTEAGEKFDLCVSRNGGYKPK